jgi:hypothetical protein
MISREAFQIERRESERSGERSRSTRTLLYRTFTAEDVVEAIAPVTFHRYVSFSFIKTPEKIDYTSRLAA